MQLRLDQSAVHVSDVLWFNRTLREEASSATSSKEEEMTETVTHLHFWRLMTYRCNGCGRELRMHLENGCEGPVVGGTEARIETPFGPGLLRFTPNGRLIQPVPFSFACTCSVSGAYMSHVHWNADIEVDIWDDEPNFPHFRYNFSENINACGIPVGVS